MTERLQRILPLPTAALTLVTVALAASLGRLFIDGTDVVMPLVVIALVGHLLAGGARAANLRLRWSLSVSLAASLATLSWLHYPDAGWFGMFLPSTYRAAGNDISVALEPLRQLVAPIDATVGFEVMLGVVVAVIATFADAAAFRASARFQAVVPHLALFVYGAVLARGDSATLAALAFGASLVLWSAVSQGLGAPLASRTPAWFVIGPAIGVIVVGAVIAALVPTNSGDGVVDLRAIGRPAAPRTIVTPLVGIGASLGTLSDTQMFEVTSPTPHYWRLTTLEDFDGATWTSTARYDDVGSAALDRSTPDSVPTTVESQRITIRALSSDWVPTAHEVSAVESDTALRYDTDSSSLFYDAEGGGSPATEVRVTAAVPQYPTGIDQSAGRDASLADADDYRSLPGEGFREQMASIVRQIPGLADVDSLSNTQVAQRLQNWFRNEFRYDLDVDYQREANPINAFLAARVGFCQQFATTFAAMTRSVGIPTRVAVGFTYGDEGVDEDGERKWTVRGRHAHAWPEIWTDEMGWVAFEPTPGRGNPDTAVQTGVPASQAAPGGGTEQQPAEVPETTEPAPTTTAVPSPQSTTPATPDTPVAAVATSDGSGSGWPLTAVLVAGAVVVALLMWIGLVAWNRQRRRRVADTDELVAIEWTAAVRDLRAVGLLQQPDESPIEFATRAADELALRQLVELGDLESRRRFAAASLTPDEAQRATAICHDVLTEVSKRTGPAHTVGRALGSR